MIARPLLSLGVALALAGCGAAASPPLPPQADADATARPTAAATATPTPAPTAVATPSATPTATPSRAPRPTVAPTDSAKAGKATGPVTDEPFTVRGVVVVSKDHRLSARYVPPWAGRPHGLHPDVTAAFARLQAAARADGLTLSIRSGYRSWSAQKASFEGALREYDEKTARLFFAEPGASEHQTGLALDAWDGRNRGTAFTRTAEARWLAAHAHAFGFIIRYPAGRTDVTGYAGESWHLRWVGTDISAAFGPNATLTLEEYLGLA